MMSSSVAKFVSEEKQKNHEDGDGDNKVLGLLHMTTTSDMYKDLRDCFLRAAIYVKDQVVQVTWKEMVEKGDIGSSDTSVCTGLLGTAFTCLRSYEATGCVEDLRLCAEIVHACAAADHPSSRHVTFLCGRGGVYAIGAVAANYCRDQKQLDLYLNHFLEVAHEKALPVGPEEGGLGMSYELLYGRAGFLWAALFINKHLGPDTIPLDSLMPIVEAIVAGGKAGATGIACPLMYRWHGTRYWGAAHGLAGILHVLLHFPLPEHIVEDMKGTLRYMMRNRFPHSGNYPVSEGDSRDKLQVQWSQGATGIAMALCKAAEVFADEREFRDGAIEAGEVVWKSGLVRKVGLADGVSGNAYAFLSLYRLTGDSIYEDRAKAFGSYLYHHHVNNNDNQHHHHRSSSSDDTYSLFQGLAGAACLWFDLLAPHASRFPGFEL